MFQPPPAPPPPPEVVRTESAYLQAARRDMPLTLVRVPARGKEKDAPSEKALIRYRLYVRTDVEATQPPLGDGPAVAAITCAWTVLTFLQREPCFESITGRMACGESYTIRLEERQSGRETLVTEPAACGLTLPASAAAEARLRAVLAEKADALFDDDFARRFTAEMTKAGIAVRPRPPK